MPIIWIERLFLLIILILLILLRRWLLKIVKENNSLVEMRANGAIIAIAGWLLWTFFRD